MRPCLERRPGATPQPYPELAHAGGMDSEANSHYECADVKVTRRFSQGLTYLAGYTWSKSIDTGSGIRTLGADTLFPQDSYCGSCAKALSFAHAPTVL